MKQISMLEIPKFTHVRGHDILRYFASPSLEQHLIWFGPKVKLENAVVSRSAGCCPRTENVFVKPKAKEIVPKPWNFNIL